MKRITKFLILFLCFGGLFSVGVLKDKEKPTQKVDAASPDFSGYRYKFEVPGDFGNIWLMAFGAGNSSQNFNDWCELTNYSYSPTSTKIFTFTTNVYYSGFTLTRYRDNVDYCKSADISVGNRYTATWQWDGVNGHTPTATFPSGGTFYLYDYKNIFGGNAKCYAWQSHGNISNANYPGVDMNKVQYGSGQLYSIGIDNIYDMAIFGVGDSANTGDQWINLHRGECFCWWDTGNSSWNADLDWIKAHDWIYNTMHVRDILQTNTSDTGACRGENGYYQKAKTAYQNFSSSIRTKISEDECFYAAQARFAAWAEANNETASISGTTLTITPQRYGINEISKDDNNFIIILIVSIVSITSLGLLLVLKRKAIVRK